MSTSWTVSSTTLKLASDIMVLKLFLLLACLLSETTHTSSGNETDRRALLAFKDQITSDPLGVLTSWNDSLHFCQWQGVTCRPRHQRITVLNLEDQKLTGTLSPSIGNLSFLRVIKLGSNNFQGEIPPEVGNLFRLQLLNLSQNSFGGKIPANISHCLNLKILNLNQNSLVGRIPLELSSLSKLELLKIAANSLTGIIPPSLANISSLSVLSLARNNLVGGIPPDLGQLANLTFLQVSQNKLSGTIPSSLYNLSSINIFSVADNQLHGKLPRNLGICFPNLEMLLVGTNQFTGSIPASIVNASRLEELFFTYNEFSGSVPENLGSLSALVKINLAGNKLGGKMTNDLNFLISLNNCTRLETLDISGNSFKSPLPHSITNLSTHLKLLTTGRNEITGTIPPGIDNLLNLAELGFESNFLTGIIPVSLGELQNLEFLTMWGNRLTGQIPASFGNLSSLSVLDLGQNALSGSIPSSLGSCHKLQYLRLSRNNLNGSIPREIMNLPSLSIFITLEHNSLEGSLPPEVGNLKNLAGLDASENKLSGEIPPTLANCLSLVYLNLMGNSFSGTIPQKLSNLRGLQELDLSHNKFSGQIPEYLETFPFLEKLNLSFNNLEGEVPKRGVFTNVSAISILGNTKLCGGIHQLQLPICRRVEDSKEKRGSAPLKVIIPVVSVALFLVSISATLYWKRKSRKNESSTVSLAGHLRLSYNDLFKSTNGFSSDNLIGEGSYGSVYKGILDREDVAVAVKVLNVQQRGVPKSFMAECKALRNTRHRNLIKIISSCSGLDYKGNDFRAVVFEFMPNGTLDDWLHPQVHEQCEPRNLNLRKRLNIAHDVSYALDYLHHDCETPIVHCDVKPSNVLLDEEMNAHVSDFGLARFLSETGSGDSQSQTSLVGLKGTIGYVAPECGVNGEMSTHSDVYSYGILVLEMFTGKRPTEDLFKDGLSLHDYAKTAFPDRVMEIVDPTLLSEEANINNADRDEIYDSMEECLVNLIAIGLQCSVATPSARMNMRDVVTKIQVIKDLFPEAVAHERGVTQVPT